MPVEIPGQLNEAERRIISGAILDPETKPKVALEVGTWLGGGSTASILHALEKNGEGHLWGIEADESVFARMVENIRATAPEATGRFTPLFGFSQQVIPRWLTQQAPQLEIDFAFLDGGNNPLEQIIEFELIDPRMPIGSILMTHDAKLRKGKWLVPYLSSLDNWETKLHDISLEGLFAAKKIALRPSRESLRIARRRLRHLRLEPAELAAALLPAGICGILLKLMPRRLSLKLAEGRS